MALAADDRVKQTSTTTGTGTYDLTGTVAGFQIFVTGIGTGNTCWYSATDGTDWEVGVGTVTDAATDTLARTSILSSSNADAAVNWAAGTRTLACTWPASVALTAANLVEPTAAAQSDQETGSSTTTYVSPGRQQFHLSACKCHGFTTGAGTPSLHANSYNTTSIADGGTGILTVTIATDFSSANWTGVCSGTISTTANRMCGLVTKAAGTINLETSSATATLADPGDGWNWAFYGDQ